MRFLCMWHFWNPTIEVVTFCLHGWCMLGVFLLSAFTNQWHECQDLLSPWDGMLVCTDLDLGFMLSFEKFLRNGVRRTHDTSKGKNNNNRIQRRYSRYFTISSSATNCLQHARSSGPGAIVCKSRATHQALITCKCHVMCHLVRRDSSAVKFDRVEIAFIWALFYWLTHF